MSRWLWNEEDVQQDLLLLQKKYKELGYDLTKEQCYDIWYMYSQYCHANWIVVSKDVSNSEWCIKRVLGIS